MENIKDRLEPESLAYYTIRISALQGSKKVCKAFPGQIAAPPMAETSSL